MGQGRTRTKQKRQKKEQFVRPMTTMTLVVPFFFPPRHFGVLHLVTIWRARGERKTRRTTRRPQRRSTRKSANRFERNPHFCVGARAREIAREVAWPRKRLERDTSRLRERGTPVDLERHFESRIGEKARGKEGHRRYARSFFASAPRARARKKSARRIATPSRSISRGATDENAFRSRAKERHFFLRVVGGREFVRCLGQTNTP